MEALSGSKFVLSQRPRCAPSTGLSPLEDQAFIQRSANTHHRRVLLKKVCRSSTAFVLLLLLLLNAFAANCQAEIGVPRESENSLIELSAQTAHRWKEGAYEVWLLRDGSKIKQGNTLITSNEAIVWLDSKQDSESDEPDKAIIYAEGNVEVKLQRDGAAHQISGQAAQTIRDQQWLGRLHSNLGVQMNVGTLAGKPANDPPIFNRGKAYRSADVAGQVLPVQWIPDDNSPRTVEQLPANDPNSQNLNLDSSYYPQFNQAQATAQPTPQQNTLPLGQLGFPPVNSAANSETRVRFLPRGTRAPSLKSFPSTGGSEQIWIVTGGVKVVVESDQLNQIASQDPDIGREVVIEADQVVAWTNSLAQLRANGQPVGPADRRWELYMEGNIIFASGRRVIYADRMFYDTVLKRGTILNAEMLTPMPGYDGLVRLKSDVLQQMDATNFRAYGAAVTSSRMGVPRYWVQSNELEISQLPTDNIDPLTGYPRVNPETGLPENDPNYLINSRNNFIYLGQTPVFYWPRLTTDLQTRSYYLTGLELKNDNVFGSQILTEWDLYQLLGIRNPPPGTKWNLDVDYLSERGPALGTKFKYGNSGSQSQRSPYFGELDIWGINDNGLDNLGRDRRAIDPGKDFRGRGLFRHRHRFGDGWQFTAQAGLISDANFLQEYFIREWNEEPDQVTSLELKKLFEDQSFNVEASVRVNDFFTQTQSLPRFDHFLLGRSLLNDRFTYYAHSQVGYLNMRTAEPAADPVDQAKFTLLPGEANVEGLRAVTRQELDLPLNLGPVKTVPYVLGEAAYWGEDLSGNSLTRLYGQAGIRSSLPFWRVNNDISSVLLNLNGLAHKVTLDSDVYFAEASQNLGDLALYDNLDDDAQEAFRRRMTFDTFGGAIPAKYDYRSYALRSGQQSNVTSPTTEIADDLFAVNLGLRNRWQTKRGLPGFQRTIDWITFDIQATYFPKASRDNFDADVGLVDYDFRWHLGDRLALVSDGFFDFFGQGMRTASAGVIITRPEVGNVYLGFRTIEGPISSNVVNSSYNYRMSDKWVVSANSSYDFGPTGNIGQRLAFTRIGESFLVTMGANWNVSQDSFGVIFGVEPRIYARSRAATLGGVPLPAVGARGLE